MTGYAGYIDRAPRRIKHFGHEGSAASLRTAGSAAPIPADAGRALHKKLGRDRSRAHAVHVIEDGSAVPSWPEPELQAPEQASRAPVRPEQALREPVPSRWRRAAPAAARRPRATATSTRRSRPRRRRRPPKPMYSGVAFRSSLFFRNSNTVSLSDSRSLSKSIRRPGDRMRARFDGGIRASAYVCTPSTDRRLMVRRIMRDHERFPRSIY